MSAKTVDLKEFFEFIFGRLDGYLCLFTIDRSKGKHVKQHFFEYPEQLSNAISFTEKNSPKVDVYFSPFLYTKEERKKEYIAETPVAWADGDDCPIDSLLIQPSAVVRSSEGKYHFYWKFDPVETPDVGESVSKRIAYHHADEGMDKSGWDLTQLLRVPGTYNHKTTPPQEVSRAVIIRDAKYVEADFAEYPEVDDGSTKLLSYEELKLPNETPEQLFERYKISLNPRALDLYSTIPVGDWSAPLWELELTLLESGMTKEETFVIARNAECNKYKRDGRPMSALWKDVQRAAAYAEGRREQPPQVEGGAVLKLDPPKLLTEEERELVRADRTFIEDYTEWAKTLGDAAAQYHPAGAFVILSSLMCGTVKLPTSFGTIVPNLWFMILADTTLTRKSTAMENATDLLMEVDDDILLATDGSIEGLLTAMAGRSGKPSLFLRDEITGLIEAMSKKEYMAGMMETLTKLYDGKHMKRILRRETIDVADPRLVLFAGGIRNRMVELIDYKHVGSGFLPRFIFITAESDITKLKPVGPPTTTTMDERNSLMEKMREVRDRYAPAIIEKASTEGVASIPKQWAAELTSDAWQLYNSYEVKMYEFAIKSYDPTLLTPMMDRLAKSGLKAAVLIAGSRMEDDKIIVDVRDLHHAFFYVEQWIHHTAYMIKNIGTSGDESKLQKAYAMIQSDPGIVRSKVMQNMFLTSREADNIFKTLEERDAIRRERTGRGERLYPVGS